MRVSGDGHRRRRQKTAEHDGRRRQNTAAARRWRTAEADGIGNFRRARTMKIAGARAGSSRLRLQRGQRLQLSLDERNTMMALHVRYSQRLRSYRGITKRTKLSLTAWRFSEGFLLRRTVVTSLASSRHVVVLGRGKQAIGT
ncbi:hypothetical protein DY000_02053191 [Brassica cretica]|uniref:Uncharacterized protein n=1 Tax=Brassica cretica TaxID=69181 RepID=A0ABQ7AIG4_BRACR|nr:hypothetical protein DY000_02053191 [Brassica cretica]